MRPKMRFRHPILSRLLFIGLSLVFTTIGGLNWIGYSMDKTILKIAELQSQRLATMIVNKAIEEKIIDKIDQDEVVTISKLSDGTVANLSFNTNILNKALNEAINSIQKNLKYIEKGEVEKLNYPELDDIIDSQKMKKGIFYEIPYGVALNYPLLANVGPYIPVRFSIVGSVTGDLRSDVKNYGINNVLIEIVSTINIKTQVIIPLASSISEVNVNIPIAINIIQGEVPLYYQGSYKITDGGLAIPIG